MPGRRGRAMPGIGACSLPSPRQGRDSSYRGRDSDFALHRGRFSDFAVASDFARKIIRKRCGGERISGVGFHPENPITGPAPKVCQRCCPRSIADRVFFHHSHALPSILPWQQDCPFNPAVATGLLHPILPWQQDCPFNPAVATGLLHPILLWQQDCFTQSCCGNRIAPSILLWQQDCFTYSCAGNRIAPVHYEQLGLGTVLARAQACDGVGPAVELPGLGHVVDADDCPSARESSA